MPFNLSRRCKIFKEIVRYLVEIILILSALTLAAAVTFILLRLRRKKGTGLASTATAQVGILNAVVGLGLGLSGAQVSQPDPGNKTIASFYRHFEAKDFDRAWERFSLARKTEIAGTLRSAEDFRKSYRHTLSYSGREICLDRAEGPDSHLYWVNFDVYDRYSYNSIYPYNWEPLQDSVDDGLINGDWVIVKVVQDIRRSYILPDE